MIGNNTYGIFYAFAHGEVADKIVEKLVGKTGVAFKIIGHLIPPCIEIRIPMTIEITSVEEID